MTAPLTPPDCDLRGMPYMPLDIARLFNSDLYILSTGDEFKAALSLWAKSFLQVPAGSLPDDERVLAHLSGAGAAWPGVRAMALHGWVRCDDGRLYHRTVCEKAREAWQVRRAHRARTVAATAARIAQSRSRENVTFDGTTDVASGAALTKGREGKGRRTSQGSVRARSARHPPLPELAARRARRPLCRHARARPRGRRRRFPPLLVRQGRARRPQGRLGPDLAKLVHPRGARTPGTGRADRLAPRGRGPPDFRLNQPRRRNRMTNPLTPSTPAVPALPGSPALAAALADIAGGVDVFGAGVPVRVIAEARAALEAAPIRPAGRRTLFDWLRPVVAAVRNPPDRQRVEDFAGAVAAACCDLPAEIWTLEALRAGLREWKFWPSVAEVRAVVRAAAAPELARRSALRLLAAARPRPEPAPRTPPTPEQLQAVAELVASVRARLHARQAQGRTRR